MFVLCLDAWGFRGAMPNARMSKGQNRIWVEMSKKRQDTIFYSKTSFAWHFDRLAFFLSWHFASGIRHCAIKSDSAIPEVRLIGEKSKKLKNIFVALTLMIAKFTFTSDSIHSICWCSNLQSSKCACFGSSTIEEIQWGRRCESEDRRTFSECLRKSGLTWPKP